MAKGIGRTGAMAMAAIAAMALAAPDIALATDAATLTDDVKGLFGNIQNLAFVVYEGIIGCAAVIAFISIGKELIPALLSSNREERAQFKGRISAAIVTIVVLVALALAPVLVPAAVSYFGGTADIGMSIVTEGI